MAERGTEHEAAVAKEKLAKLHETFEFSKSAEGGIPDLFASIHISRQQGSHSACVLRVEKEIPEVGSYVQWAFAEKLNLEAFWKKIPSGASELHVFVSKTDAAELKSLATHIYKSFLTLWTEFSKQGLGNSAKRAPFLSGLYDGMMGDGRPEGLKVPQTLGGHKKKKKAPRKSSKPAEPPHVEIHPYELGLTMGRQIAMKLPPKALTGELRKLVEQAAG
jgi:hypothetical protein